MSEAILYALDAPTVRNADAATAFVDKWQDNEKAPTANIGAFFARLLEAWPIDGSALVWREGFDHSRPAGPLLVMSFELRVFDNERLRQLLALAAHQGILIFDPEAHVLYLPDGSEAGGQGMTPPAPGAPSRCKSGVRFDGVYETKKEKGWSYLCFTEDGQIFWQSTAGRFLARAAMDSFGGGDSFIVKGKYKPGDKAFSARLKASFGLFKMQGAFEEDGLHVHSERTDGRYPYDAVYTFIPL